MNLAPTLPDKAVEQARITLTALGDERASDTLVLVRLKLAQHKVSISFLPPPRPAFVEAHKGQIQHVLLTLLINAMQAMPDGGSSVLEIGSIEHAGVQRRLLDLIPLFGSTGHHHIPIIGEGERLVGMITQSDVVAALGRAADPTV